MDTENGAGKSRCISLTKFVLEKKDLERKGVLSTFQEHLKGFLDQLNKYITQHSYAE